MRRGSLPGIALLMCSVLIRPEGLAADSRLQSVPYAADQIYVLRAQPGFQIDLEFDRDERFVGLGSGDVEALSFEAQDNHLFIKPKAASIHTNLTVLTNRRVYHFDYVVIAARNDSRAPEARDALYALRFQYPAPVAIPREEPSDSDIALDADVSKRNLDYWFCGEETLRPLAAWDDGIHTHLRFNPRTELPAVFVRNDDGSESLLNFNVERGDVVIHRVARQFVVRRGKLAGCIANRSFLGSGRSLDSGTVSPVVTRGTRSQEVHP